MRVLAESRAGRVALGLCAALALLTLVGLVALRPGGDPAPRLAETLRQDRSRAVVLFVAPMRCNLPQGRDCRQLGVRLLEGEARETTQTLTVGEDGNAPELAEGDEIVVLQDRDLRSGQLSGRYFLADSSRASTVLWLALVFGVLVVLLGRWRGVRSLVGLGASLLVVVQFVLPALLADRSPVAVAIVGALAVMLLTVVITHGLGAKSVAAILGTAASLLLTILLALLFTELASLTGLGSEEAQAVRFADSDISLQGLVVAGMVIAALGVLDDLTVSQSSTVMALRRADPAAGAARLYRSALDVGRDHAAATVNTLVFAYVGASLPLLLYFGVGGIGLRDALDREEVAQQAIATLVGSIGLLAAVPVTTAVAALLAARLPAATTGDEAPHVH